MADFVLLLPEKKNAQDDSVVGMGEVRKIILQVIFVLGGFLVVHDSLGAKGGSKVGGLSGRVRCV